MGMSHLATQTLGSTAAVKSWTPPPYPILQWAAVKTQLRLTSAPPQKWKPVFLFRDTRYLEEWGAIM